MVCMNDLLHCLESHMANSLLPLQDVTPFPAAGVKVSNQVSTDGIDAGLPSEQPPFSVSMKEAETDLSQESSQASNSLNNSPSELGGMEGEGIEAEGIGASLEASSKEAGITEISTEFIEIDTLDPALENAIFNKINGVAFRKRAEIQQNTNQKLRLWSTP